MLSRKSDKGTAIFFILICEMKSTPKKNSIPSKIRASHSAAVQLRNEVSTIVHPNCSSDGSLEIADMIKTQPTKMQMKLNRIFFKRDIVC